MCDSRKRVPSVSAGPGGPEALAEKHPVVDTLAVTVDVDGDVVLMLSL